MVCAYECANVSCSVLMIGQGLGQGLKAIIHVHPCIHTCGGMHVCACMCVYTGCTICMVHYVRAVYTYVHVPCGSLGVGA